MKFTYKAKSAGGAIVKGVVLATDKLEATKKLEADGKTPILVEAASLFSLDVNIPFLSGVKLSEKIVFTKNLSGMLKAGLSLSRALQVLERQSKGMFRNIISDLISTIDKGGTLSTGLEKHPGVFSTLFVAMIRSGEESGGLPQALSEVGQHLEKTYLLTKKIKSALTYPSVIVAAIVLIGILMFVYVVPTLVGTFKELGVDLPASTRLIIWLSDLISGQPLLFIGGLVGLVALGVFFSRAKSTKRYFDILVLRLPVIGAIAKEMNTARTARTLSSLLAAGVDISRAISITKEVVQNVRYRAVLDEAVKVVERGEPLSRVFEEAPTLYPVMMSEMVEVGEETGRLGGMLLDVALFYEGEVESKTKDLSTIIEPVLMIIVGAAVGFFAVSMLTPMYSVMDSIK